MFRYVTNILEDAKVYSQHAGKKNIDLDDVKLSVSMSTEQTFTSPPPREALLELARIKNSVQLPIPTNKLGLRLPPDRHCLTNTNYKLKTQQKPSGFLYGINNTDKLSQQIVTGRVQYFAVVLLDESGKHISVGC